MFCSKAASNLSSALWWDCWPSWDMMPSGPIFEEGELDCDRGWPHSQHSCRCEAVNWQVTRSWTRTDARPPGRPVEKVQVKFTKRSLSGQDLDSSNLITNKTASLDATSTAYNEEYSDLLLVIYSYWRFLWKNLLLAYKRCWLSYFVLSIQLIMAPINLICVPE